MKRHLFLQCRPTTIRHARRVAITVAVLAFLPTLYGCPADEPPALSLEEAKQITTTFQGSTFTAPPRSISDVTAILKEGAHAKSPEVVEARRMAKKRPSADLKGIDLARFYQRRGLAAREFGAARQSIEDITRADQLAENASSDLRGEIQYNLGFAKASGGNFSQAVRHFGKSIELAPNRGVEFRRLVPFTMAQTDSGRLEGAEKSLARMKTLANNAPPSSATRMESLVDSQTARLALAKGKLKNAEELYRSVIPFYRSLTNRYGKVGKRLAWRSFADTLLRQGRLVEAEVEARNAVTVAIEDSGVNSPSVAHTLSILIAVIDAQGRHIEAERLARATLKIFERAGSAEASLLWVLARRQLAGALVNQGRWREARDVFNAIENALTNDPRILDRLFTKDLIWPLVLLGAGQPDAALSRARAARRRLRSEVGDKHYDTALARGILATILAAAGKPTKALAEFRGALPILLTRSRRSEADESRRGTNRKVLEAIFNSYIALNSRIHGAATKLDDGIDAAAEAFRIADVARSQAVQGALAASGARAAAGNPDLADLIRREQDAQKQIAALFAVQAKLLSEPSGQRDAGALTRLRSQIDDLRKAGAALEEEIGRRFPDYADLINPSPATITKVQATLRSGEALIATYVTDEKTYVWAVPKSGKVAFIAASLNKERIAMAVKDLRRALDPQATTLGGIPAFNVGLSHDLYRTLLEPVKAGWQDAKNLLVVSHDALGQLPFSVLVTERASLPADSGALFSNYKKISFLARSHAVTVLPSVTSLTSLRSLPSANPARRSFVGFGDPYFNAAQAAAAARPKSAQTASVQSRGGINVRGLPVNLRSVPKTASAASADLSMLPRLPDTLDEVRSIAIALNADLTKDVFTGRKASEGAVKSTDLSAYKVVTFATHGLVPGELNGLHQPALALTAPAIAGDRINDGLLTMGEILGLRLDADWVVLSACNTGAGNGAGAEAFSGLGRAFFYAGTRALLLSNWPVETSSARLLTTDIFKRQSDDPSITRAQALRRSMLALIDGKGFVDSSTGKVVFSYAHPIFWAPFSLVGDGGGGKPAS